MSDATIQRLQSDLKTIRQAAGIDFPFNRAQFPVKYIYAVSGLTAAAWAWFAINAAPLLLIGVFIFLLFAPAVLYGMTKAAHSKKAKEELCETTKRASGQLIRNFFSYAIAGILGGSLGIWLKISYGLDIKGFFLIVSIFVGTVGFILALNDRNALSALPVGAVLIVVALLWLLTPIPFLVLFGLFWFITHILEVVMWKIRLRQLDQWE